MAERFQPEESAWGMYSETGFQVLRPGTLGPKHQWRSRQGARKLMGDGISARPSEQGDSSRLSSQLRKGPVCGGCA